MRSGTSFFNFTVFKKTLFRFWPIWAANLAVWLVVFPLNILVRLQNGVESDRIRGMTANLAAQDMATVIVIGALGITALAAMAVCSHLYTSRSANFFGTLPVKREGLFLSAYLAGLCMLLGPNLIIFLLMIPVEAAAGALLWTPLLFWLWEVSVMELFFYSFAVFCGMFTGHILALPVYTGVFNFIVLAVYALGEWIMSGFYYGYTRNYGDGGLLERAVQWLTPAMNLTEVGCYPNYQEDSLLFQFDYPERLNVYAVAGVCFAVFALLLYKRRHNETAGDVVAIKPLRPVFRFGVAVCAGIALGLLTAMFVNLHEPGMMVSVLIWTVIGSFVAQMLLDKSFKVFHKWKGAAAAVGVMALLFLVIGFDLTGYETRIPAVDRVDYVEVSGLGCPPGDSAGHWYYEPVPDPENVERIVALHKLAVADRDDGAWMFAERAWGFRLVYHLKNGGTMARSYTLYGGEDDLHTEGTAVWLIQQLLDDRDLTRQRYKVDEAQRLLNEGGRISSVELWGFAQQDSGAQEPDYSDETDRYEVVLSSTPGTSAATVPTKYDGCQYLYGADAMDLWQAVLTDLENGDLGQHYALDSTEVLSWPRVQFNFVGPTLQSGPSADETIDIDVAVPGTAFRTWAVLDRLGLEAEG